MKLLIVTDAWHPQVNGVVRTLTQMRDGLRARGWQVAVAGPTGPTLPCPTYPEIKLTLRPREAIERALAEHDPDCIHIATEGPLGHAMRHLCLSNGWRFTTSFHTRFPEYLKARFLVPEFLTYMVLRFFHSRAHATLVPTPSVRSELLRRGFRNVRVWGRGVDTSMFHPARRRPLPYPGPVFLYVGRLAVEKNVEAFLNMPLTCGTKLVVGDGPALASLRERYPDAVFLGPRFGEELASLYASADVFVFPSRTDTFGLVILEALASGTPVAAFPVPGPKDILTDPRVGNLDEDLLSATRAALTADRKTCRDFALENSWDRSIGQFESALRIKSGERETIRLDTAQVALTMD